MPSATDIVIKQLDMELNGGCNYKCPMCPQSEGREKAFLKKLPLELFQKVVNDALQYGLEAVSLHGSGEPTLNRNIADYIRFVKSRNIRCITFTNGYKLDDDLSREIIAAGLDVLRVSCIGYDAESYTHWMGQDSFDRVRTNIKRFVELNREMGGRTEVILYHLVTNIARKDHEVDAYRRNWVDHTGALAEIWLMHSWAGSDLDLQYKREQLVRDPSFRRSCGRPFSPLLQVRAGGLDGHMAAVVTCCMVLGKDSSAVLGHLDTQSIHDVVTGAPFEEVRRAHAEQRFDDISYCKNCDLLYDVPEALVWSNLEGRKYGQSIIVNSLDHREFAPGES